jgi:hypothetical protein
MRKTIRRTALLLALGALTLGAGACNRNRDLGPLMGGRGRNQPVQLTVQNNRFEDAAIYAIWQGGTRHRVGLATGTTSSTFSFEWRAEVIRFEVDFIAADGYMVDPIEVSPGDHLDLVILGGGGE